MWILIEQCPLIPTQGRKVKGQRACSPLFDIAMGFKRKICILYTKKFHSKILHIRYSVTFLRRFVGLGRGRLLYSSTLLVFTTSIFIIVVALAFFFIIIFIRSLEDFVLATKPPDPVFGSGILTIFICSYLSFRRRRTNISTLPRWFLQLLKIKVSP